MTMTPLGWVVFLISGALFVGWVYWCYRIAMAVMYWADEQHRKEAERVKRGR